MRKQVLSLLERSLLWIVLLVSVVLGGIFMRIPLAKAPTKTITASPTNHVISNKDNGASVTIPLGDTVTLAVAGASEASELASYDNNILEDISTGTSLMLRALRAGTSEVKVNIKPVCAVGSACPQHIRLFKMTILVR